MEVVDAVILSEAEASDSRAASAEAGARDSAWTLPPPLSAAAELRASLLSLCTPLDRGSLASGADDAEVRRLASELASEAARRGKWRLSFPEDLQVLEGRWKLLYSSAFAASALGASLGGLRPGPPLDSPLLEVGDIVQRYRVNESRADTVVRLRPPRWLRETGFLERVPLIGADPDTVLTLSQQFDVASNDTLRFAFADGEVANKVVEQLKPLRFPLSPLGLGPDTSRDTPFTDTLVTTYCDRGLRIGLGGRFGELRVFVRD